MREALSVLWLLVSQNLALVATVMLALSALALAVWAALWCVLGWLTRPLRRSAAPRHH